MSTAWKGPVVLLREPASAAAWRLGRRILIAGLLTLVVVFGPWLWVQLLAGLGAVLAWAFVAFGVINTVRNKRVLLVHQGSGAIEWPRSVQEVLLRRPTEFVAGPEIEVTYPPIAALPGTADPRVAISDGERTIRGLPLYGVKPEDFVARANALLAGRGTVLVYVDPATDAQGDGADAQGDGADAQGDGADAQDDEA